MDYNFLKSNFPILAWREVNTTGRHLRKQGERGGLLAEFFHRQTFNYQQIFALLSFSFWPNRKTWEILVPQRLNLLPLIWSALKVQSINHWTTREAPYLTFHSHSLICQSRALSVYELTMKTIHIVDAKWELSAFFSYPQMFWISIKVLKFYQILNIYQTLDGW